MGYETIAGFTRIWGMLFFIVVFAVVLVYALRPSNRGKFDRAANAPLDDDTLED